jgi:hypothetical protein
MQNKTNSRSFYQILTKALVGYKILVENTEVQEILVTCYIRYYSQNQYGSESWGLHHVDNFQ